MGRSNKHKARDKNKGSLPQVPKNLKSDGQDVEFSRETADQGDLEALARANAANQRVQQKRSKK
ncbi:MULTISPECIES: YfhD family protein [unclassified Bacillus (in: firmicutes)]|uniref:YfhD family protein n=1 Tax=unclassified Bacillus (in: firmicutes) TaxID=185979 RepID=UPI0008EE19D4|nr:MULTISPECIES: YfhD family protein [unclassified Bacillus (in: firmicutes)]SFB09908.1 YfhD-like protein [Bacillus sp. UNCCL13]SFQ86494.1 YfhD-like protein [Bacillus sp. cl95]